MEKRTLAIAGVACVGLVSIALALESMRSAPSRMPEPAPSIAPLDPPPVAIADASPTAPLDAVAGLDEDAYMHHAFVAVGPGDVTVWKDRSSTIRTEAGTLLCDRCIGGDFVVTRGHVAWLQLLETDLPGFDATVRTTSTTSAWQPSDAGSSLSWGDRAASLNNPSAIATDGTSVFVAEGKEDDAGNGYAQSIVRVDLARSTKTLLAKTAASIRDLVYASGEVFATWSATVDPVWRVQAVSTKGGALRDVVTLPFPLPDETASSTELFFFYRDDTDRSSRGHFASVPLAGGPITTIYDTAPAELVGHFAADDSGLYVVRFVGQWVLTRFAKGTPPRDLARFDAMPRAIAPRKTDVAVAFLDELKLVQK